MLSVCNLTAWMQPDECLVSGFGRYRCMYVGVREIAPTSTVAQAMVRINQVDVSIHILHAKKI